MSSSAQSDTRTLRIRLRDKHAKVLREFAYWVNQVWNYDNELSQQVLRREGRFLSGYDLDTYTSGASKAGVPLHSQTIQAVNAEYATRRRQFKKARLNWRVSNPRSSKYSLGWIPFKAAALRYRDGQVWFAGIDIPLGLWDSYGLAAYAKDGILGPGCFAEDARGRWFLCVQVQVPRKPFTDSATAIGIDLGSKTAATLSHGKPFEAKFYHALEDKLAIARRACKKARVKAINAKIKNQRKDALHQFTRALVNQHGAMFIGNISSAWQTATGNGKSVLDASWGALKTQLLYKGEHAGKWVEIVDESYSTQDCSHCGARTGPKGRDELHVRDWTCSACGTHHDRDVNAAKNILAYGLLGVEDRVTAARLLREAKDAKTQARKTKRTANKAATAAAAGRGRLAEGSPGPL